MALQISTLAGYTQLLLAIFRRIFHLLANQNKGELIILGCCVIEDAISSSLLLSFCLLTPLVSPTVPSLLVIPNRGSPKAPVKLFVV